MLPPIACLSWIVGGCRKDGFEGGDEDDGGGSGEGTSWVWVDEDEREVEGGGIKEVARLPPSAGDNDDDDDVEEDTDNEGRLSRRWLHWYFLLASRATTRMDLVCRRKPWLGGAANEQVVASLGGDK